MGTVHQLFGLFNGYELIPLVLIYYPVCALLGPQRCPD
jgi:hypothetical protein